MSVTEEQRRNLYAALERLIGPDQAVSLMELLPRHPPSELVTRSDAHANTIMLRGEMSELRSELCGEMSELRSELRGEMVELRSELQDEMTVLSAELRSEMAGLSSRLDARMVSLEAGLRGDMAELRGDVRQQIGGLYRWGAALLATNGAALIAALVA